MLHANAAADSTAAPALPWDARQLRELEDKWSALDRQHPPEQPEQIATAALHELFAACRSGRAEDVLRASERWDACSKVIIRDAFTGLSREPCCVMERRPAATPAALKRERALSSTQYRKLLMGKPLASRCDRPPPFHTQVNAFGKRAAAARSFSVRGLGVMSGEAERQWLAASDKSIPAAGRNGNGGGQGAARGEEGDNGDGRRCPLCLTAKARIDSSGGAKYCWACESLRWEGRKAGVRMAALRQALAQGGDNVVARAVKIQGGSVGKSTTRQSGERRGGGAESDGRQEKDSSAKQGATKGGSKNGASRSSPVASSAKMCTLCLHTFTPDPNSGSGAAASYCSTCSTLKGRVRQIGYTVDDLRHAFRRGLVVGAMSTDALKLVLDSIFSGKSLTSSAMQASARAARGARRSSATNMTNVQAAKPAADRSGA